ncbi:MAG: DNA mismatch repair endonuclease MutL [candidate division Zixibacteria bacterium]|nr:DNA mismatch repair endonuclease MutL [candidate division Zixibacteria bacterium]
MKSPTDKKRWIRPLPERLINKIAAGEVVERPASVVKEMVENSIDAGADRIEIIVEKSGTRLIKIVDNGCGIGEDQIEIAFSRHATSKISEFDDLDRIMSYGFRGEALPSIASVSRLRMVSRPADADTGIEIIFEGGVLQTKNPIAAPVGTSIEVENLFFNTPARRKFLKAETTEARHVTRTSMALAMGRYKIGFSARVNGRKVFSLPSGLGLGERVAGLLAPGKKFVEVSGAMGPIQVEGFISPPDLARSNRNGQFIFINGRYIQSPTLAHAFAAGYGELLPRGNFPVGALLLTVDPTEVDVNVHPAKTEVRLSREREIHDALYRLVKESLRQQGVIPHLQVPSSLPTSTASTTAISQGSHPPGDNQNVIPGITRPMPTSAGQMKEIYERTPPVTVSDTPAIVQVDTSTGEIIDESQPFEPTGAPVSLQFIGSFNNLYLLFQSGSDLLIIDQHTAHERVLFEDILRQMDNEGGLAQHLLLPVQVDLGADQMTLFDEALATLNKSGFEVAPFGGQTVRIEATPAVLSRKSPEKSFLAVLNDIASLKKSGYDLNKAIAQSIACRSAVMAGDKLSDREAIGLVDSLLKCENRYSCPHGRPTFIKMSREDLDKQFGRG